MSAVQWVARESLRANDYNPNHVAPDELELLRISLLEDGWTQPIVIREDGEIVDGFHRWLVSGEPDIFEMTEGQVPVVKLPEDLSPAQQRMATIRHNRARGVHGVIKESELVEDMAHRLEVPFGEIQRGLGMEAEEVQRLLDHGDMLQRHGDGEFSNGWTIEKGFGDA